MSFDPNKPFTVLEEESSEPEEVKFDPSSSFEIVDEESAEFDPSKPFEVSGEFDPSQPFELVDEAKPQEDLKAGQVAGALGIDIGGSIASQALGVAFAPLYVPIAFGGGMASNLAGR